MKLLSALIDIANNVNYILDNTQVRVGYVYYVVSAMMD